MSEKSLGFVIIEELKRRKLWGYFFTFNQYYHIKKLKSEEEVKNYFREIGFGDLEISPDPSSLVNSIFQKKKIPP